MTSIVLLGSWFAIRPIVSEILSALPSIKIKYIYTDIPAHLGGTLLQNIPTSHLSDISSYSNKTDHQNHIKTILSTIPEHDYLFSINSMILLPRSILQKPSIGAINLHAGKLPEQAGSYTQQWAIIEGVETFSSTIHWMNNHIDKGDIILEKSYPVLTYDTGFTLTKKSISVGIDLIKDALGMIHRMEPLPRIQQSHTHKPPYMTKDLLTLRLSIQDSAYRMASFIRAFNSGPTSPIASVSITLDNKRFFIRQAQPNHAQGAARTAGYIYWNESGHLCLPCGEGTVLKITKIYDESKQILEPTKKDFNGDTIAELTLYFF